jgi:hypothetical protein
MLVTRLALLVLLLNAFTVVVQEGPIIDPNGGRPHVARNVRSLGSGGADPNGGTRLVSAKDDTGTCIDPNG